MAVQELLKDEAWFADVLRDRGARHPQLVGLRGLETCTDESGAVVPGGAVLSLVEGERVLVSVACVLSPGGLQIWAPKEEVVGLLELLR